MRIIDSVINLQGERLNWVDWRSKKRRVGFVVAQPVRLT